MEGAYGCLGNRSSDKAYPIVSTSEWEIGDDNKICQGIFRRARETVDVLRTDWHSKNARHDHSLSVCERGDEWSTDSNTCTPVHFFES